MSEKILKDFFKEGSAKEGESAGLLWGEPEVWGLIWPEMVRGGKSTSENRGVGEETIKGEEEGIGHNGAARETPELNGVEARAKSNG